MTTLRNPIRDLQQKIDRQDLLNQAYLEALRGVREYVAAVTNAGDLREHRRAQRLLVRLRRRQRRMIARWLKLQQRMNRRLNNRHERRWF